MAPVRATQDSVKKLLVRHLYDDAAKPAVPPTFLQDSPRAVRQAVVCFTKDFWLRSCSGSPIDKLSWDGC